MSAQHHRLALCLQLADQPLDQLHVDRVQPLEGFIQDEEFRIVDQAGHKLELLLHPPAEVFHLVAGPIGQFHSLQPVESALAGGGARSALEFSQVDKHIEHLEVRVQPSFLRQVADAVPGDSRRLAQHGHAAGVGLEDVHHHADAGGLSSPIGSQESEDLSPVHVK